ncbi:MAG: NarK/NasA family nitrate transporter [Sphingobium sp.]|mgnify:FL=1|uniref:NarK/NasA family nitrate transporter n=1 Tax=Sphingobium xenophagum TaxID=121428 RepID=A0A249MXT2_SPHXE|nr:MULTISPECIES: nitrate/nitrite transporter [Sphingobium]MBU0659299.1 NarK/NasA family nitrate transporter [Alphaproteobacteria bacterium]ASY46181.1 NarK/NasA family nitrate transporter [Sphingobium xenophagum]MBA4753650.1 NarK/NasA family nitrate transporter [Sphingobium sp.]MBS90160.1 NarK/NasA family nitrate transporter [Sphingobium sp.]MBU0867895.1 NarK/NasA family nitrate transporter [Alphaproteobacteria bacterium]
MATAYWDREGEGQQPAATTSFWKAGHTPTLIAAFLYFDLAFMVWVLLGPLAPMIAKTLMLTPAEKGLMVATPTLMGALLRVVNGLLVDRIGPKLSGAISQVIVIIGLFTAWALGINSFEGTLALGVVLGFAGASFAIALPLASRWYPAEHQGKAMGLAGMGNSGTVLAALFAPGLAKLFGWNAVLGLACIPLSIVFVIYMIMAKDAPNAPPAKKMVDYFQPLKQADAWLLMAFYAVTFGGFVGLAASLPIYFTDQFGLTPVMAGYCTAGCVFAGSLVRPLGGALADRIGGVKALMMVYIVAAIALAGVAFATTLGAALGLFVIAMLALGTGNGSVFQLVPQRFQAEIGVMTGLVGMAGGIGGFYLASSLGFAKQLTGSFSAGFLIFAGLAVIAFAGLALVKARWRATWSTGARI